MTYTREQILDMAERLEAYRPPNEWGDGVRHTLCDDAAAMLRALADQTKD